MHSNSGIITSFYDAFEARNYKAMQDAYHSDAEFSDPVFPKLSAGEARAMWEMLVTSARDLRVSYSNVSADAACGSCNWEARYTFSRTGRKVVNRIRADFAFRDGKIIRHRDDFDLWRWSRMALGFPGWILGWSPLVTSKVRAMGHKSLQRFMQKQQVRSA